MKIKLGKRGKLPLKYCRICKRYFTPKKINQVNCLGENCTPRRWKNLRKPSI